MPLNLRWTTEADDERVAETRLRCYAAASKEREAFLERLRTDPRVRPGDCVLAEQDGRAVGTATALSMRMWVRGGSVPCQGVAWVGAIKTHRRGGAGSEKGIASQIMHETIRLARERGEVVSALMPFRASFYEHFGYGVMERRCDWTVPISLLPKESAGGLRYFEPTDLPELMACRQRVAQAGQCDIERSEGQWRWFVKSAEDGFLLVDRPDETGLIQGWMSLQRNRLPDGRDVAKVVELGFEDASSLRRSLGFLAGLKDQFSLATLTLPADVPLNRLLREPQITHRDARNHPTAECRPLTRMQLRILDHHRFLEAMSVKPTMTGRAKVSIHETEGNLSRFAIDWSGEGLSVSPHAGAADLECRDTTWAAIACGDLRPTDAVRLGLATGSNEAALRLLDQLAEGPAPFTHEYF